jgi:hypothetical protein
MVYLFPFETLKCIQNLIFSFKVEIFKTRKKVNERLNFNITSPSCLVWQMNKFIKISLVLILSITIQSVPRYSFSKKTIAPITETFV